MITHTHCTSSTPETSSRFAGVSAFPVFFFILCQFAVLFPAQSTVVSNQQSNVKSKTIRLLRTGTDTPVGGVTILAENSADVFVSDKNGYALLPAEGSASLKISLIYGAGLPVEKTIDLHSPETEIIYLDTQKETGRIKTRLNETVVYEIKKHRGKVTTSTSITSEELGMSTVYVMGDAMKTVQTLPGVSSSGSAFDSRMFIQGGNQWEWIAGMDGVTLQSPNRWGGGLTMLNPVFINEITLYTAGYPASLGQGLSGILDVDVKSGKMTDWDCMINTGIAASEIVLSGNIKQKVSIFFDMRRTYYEYIQPLIFRDKDLSGIQFPHLWDGVLKTEWIPTEQSKFSLLLYGSDEGMKWDFNALKDEDTGDPGDRIGTFRYNDTKFISSAQYTHNFRKKVELKGLYAYKPSMFSYRLFSASTPENSYYFTQSSSLKGNTDDHEGKLIFSHEESSRNKFSAGIFAQYQMSDAKAYNTKTVLKGTTRETTAYTVDYSGKDSLYYGAYVMNDLRIAGPLLMQTGVRFETINLTGEQNILPRGGLKLELTPDFDVYFRTGMYNLFPKSIDLYDPEIGNPNLRSEKNMHYIAGMDYETSRFTVKTEGFYKQYHDLIATDARYNYNNNSRRKVWGGNIYLLKKKKMTDWYNGWLSYTYVDGIQRTYTRSPGLYAVNAGPVDTWYTPDEMRRHTLSVMSEIVYQYTGSIVPIRVLFDKTSLSFDFRILSGKPYTPIKDVQRIYDYSDPGNPNSAMAGPFYNIVYDEYNTGRTPFYHKLDIKITLPVSPFSLINIRKPKVLTTTYVSFMDVYNRQNATSYTYLIRDSELKKAPPASSVGSPSVTSLGPDAVYRLAVKELGFMVTVGTMVLF